MFKVDFNKTRELLELAQSATKKDIIKAINAEKFGFEDFAVLFSPQMDKELLKKLAQRSMELTRKRFGRAISLYIPLYYDNRCVNGCIYCGFNAKNKIERKALTFEEIIEEAVEIRKKNFKNILLVAGEHPESAEAGYLTKVIKKLHEMDFSCVSIEIAPLEEEAYRTLVDDSHLDGVAVYQETYNPEIYDRVHTFGKKKDYHYRLATPERAASAGVSKISIGFLMGLNNFREEAINLAQHLDYLQKYHWQSEYSLSFPRIRDAAGIRDEFETVEDFDFIRIISALRLLFHETGMSISTRELPEFRDYILPLGFTNASTGSSTAPGGYTEDSQDLEQFHIEDPRTPAEMAEALKQSGFDPVWKDWE
jgi:2-iminoacetate synthase